MLLVAFVLALVVIAFLVLTGPKAVGADSTALTIADELEAPESAGELTAELKADVERAQRANLCGKVAGAE